MAEFYSFEAHIPEAGGGTDLGGMREERTAASVTSKKLPEYVVHIAAVQISNQLLFVFPFSCCFGFFLTPYAGFLVMLSLTDLLLDTGLSAASFETA